MSKNLNENLISSLIDNNSKVLDIGCGKGFMLYDFKKANSKFKVEGIDISESVSYTHLTLPTNREV